MLPEAINFSRPGFSAAFNDGGGINFNSASTLSVTAGYIGLFAGDITIQGMRKVIAQKGGSFISLENDFYNDSNDVMENGRDRAPNRPFEDDPQNGAAEAKEAIEAAIQVAVGVIANAIQGAIGKIGSCLPLGIGGQTEANNQKLGKSELPERSFGEKLWDTITFSQPCAAAERENVSDNKSNNKASYNYSGAVEFSPRGNYKQGQAVKARDYDGKWCFGTAELDDEAIRPGICPKYKFVPNDKKSYGYERYVREAYKLCKKKEPDASDSRIAAMTALNAPFEYKIPALCDYITNYNPVRQIGSVFGFVYENSAISNGCDPEAAHAYGELMTDFISQMYLENIFALLGSGIKYTNVLNAGEEVSKESIIAGSGIGNLGGKGKGEKLTELPGRNGALNQSKKDANILRTQHPDDVAKVKMTEAESRGGHVIKDENGKMVECREYYYTNREGEKVIIQEHVYPHVGSPGPHFNVRPSTDPRNGVFDGTKEHYQFKR